MPRQCIFSCVHPLYGGSGICLTEDGTCLCDNDRFSSIDAFGNPSCVLKSVLQATFLTGAVVELLLTVVLAFNIRRHWQLPQSARRGRRAAIWQRLTLVSCFATTCIVCLFSAALAATKGNRSLLELGILGIFYTIVHPSGLIGVMATMELWVDNLPSQLLDADSWATKLKTFAEDTGIFFWLGVTFASSCSVLGLAMFFSNQPRRLISIVHFVCMLSAWGSMPGVLFVAFNVSYVIDRAAGQVQPASREFYLKAKKKMWAQVVGLCGLTVIWITATGMLEFTDIGRGTPSIPWSISVVVAPTSYTVVAHLSRQKPSAASPRQVSVATRTKRTSVTTRASATSRAAGGASALPPPRDIEAATNHRAIVVGASRVIPTVG